MKTACEPFKWGDTFNDRFNSGKHTCVHTSGESSNPTWKLSFPDDMKITKVEILNRGDCCGERLEGAKVIIGDGDSYKPVQIGTLNRNSGW